MLSGLHHVTALASDAQRNLDFYTRFLGLRLVKRTVNYDDPGTHHFYFGDRHGSPGTLVTFFPWGNVRKPKQGRGQAVAIAFALAPDALEAWERRAHAANVAVIGTSHRFGRPVLTLQDPDGIALEFVGVEGCEHRRPVALAGVNLCESDLDQSDRLLRQLGLMRGEAEGTRYRYRFANGQHVDIDHHPDAELGKFAAGIIHHVALRVADEPGLIAYREQLIADGYRTTVIKDRTYFHSIYFRASSEPGHRTTLFEIATDGPGFTIDEPEVTLGSRLSLPQWLEPHRADIESRLPRVAQFEEVPS